MGLEPTTPDYTLSALNSKLREWDTFHLMSLDTDPGDINVLQ